MIKAGSELDLSLAGYKRIQTIKRTGITLFDTDGQRFTRCLDMIFGYLKSEVVSLHYSEK